MVVSVAGGPLWPDLAAAGNIRLRATFSARPMAKSGRMAAGHGGPWPDWATRLKISPHPSPQQSPSPGCTPPQPRTAAVVPAPQRWGGAGRGRVEVERSRVPTAERFFFFRMIDMCRRLCNQTTQMWARSRNFFLNLSQSLYRFLNFYDMIISNLVYLFIFSVRCCCVALAASFYGHLMHS